MSYHPEWASRSPFPPHYSSPSTLAFEKNLAIAAVLLLFGGLSLSLFDAWPSTAKRLIWESLVHLMPARLIYIAEYAMIKYKRIPGGEPRFRPEHFGDHQAKVEALHRLLRVDDGRFTATFQRVRALSGINKVLSGTDLSQPSGLGNWDNSCYQNSVLQGLASLPALGTFITGNLHAMTDEDKSPTHHALEDIMGSLNATENHTGTLWTPSALKSMDSWQQQDAQEYFSKLMDAVDQELLQSVKRRKLKSGFEALAQTSRRTGSKPLPLSNPLEGLLAQRVACKRCGHAEGLSLMPFNCLTINMGRQNEYDLEELLDEHTALEDIEGVECVKCTLLHVRSQLEKFLSDPATSETSDESTDTLKIRKIAESRLTVIQKVFENDSFSESGVLKRCNISAKNYISSIKSKQVALARTPKNLVVHINRSIFDDYGSQRKNTATVQFPPTFDLGRWCLGVKSSSAGIKEFEHWSMTSTESMLPLSEQELLDVPTCYELRCVVIHYGRHENGHYVAYGKRRSSLHYTDAVPGEAKSVDERWYCFNDEIVTAVSEKDVLDRGNVFMLFYEAVDRPQAPQHLNPTAKQTAMNTPVVTSSENDVQRTKEPGEAAVNPDEVTDKDSTISITEERLAEASLVQDLDTSLRHGEKEVPQPSEAPERAPKSATSSPSSDASSAISNLAPAMRTSSVSPALSRMERRKSSFAMPPSSIISAI